MTRPKTKTQLRQQKQFQGGSIYFDSQFESIDHYVGKILAAEVKVTGYIMLTVRNQRLLSVCTYVDSSFSFS